MGYNSKYSGSDVEQILDKSRALPANCGTGTDSVSLNGVGTGTVYSARFTEFIDAPWPIAEFGSFPTTPLPWGFNVTLTSSKLGVYVEYIVGENTLVEWGGYNYWLKISNRGSATLECVGSDDYSALKSRLGTVDLTVFSAGASDSVAAGSHSVSGGISSISVGDCSITFGNKCRAIGNNSFSAGFGTETHGDSEVALGKFNKSSVGASPSFNTQFSVGVGNSVSQRVNAIEVMKDGSVYIKGVGGYKGNNFTTSESIQSLLGEKEHYAVMTFDVAPDDTDVAFMPFDYEGGAEPLEYVDVYLDGLKLPNDSIDIIENDEAPHFNFKNDVLPNGMAMLYLRGLASGMHTVKVVFRNANDLYYVLCRGDVSFFDDDHGSFADCADFEDCTRLSYHGKTVIDNMCWGCAWLDEVHLYGVESIGSSAFYATQYVRSLYIHAENPPTLGTSPFGSGKYSIGWVFRSDWTNTLYVPSGSTGYDSTWDDTIFGLKSNFTLSKTL